MQTHAPGGQDKATDRSQTTLDFLFGVGIFALVLAFAFMFVPGMIQPFTQSTGPETVTANRVADSLAEGMLGNASTPYILNTTCTVGFFNASVPDGCTYTGTTVRDRLAIGQRKMVNVTVRGAITGVQYHQLCWNGSALAETGTTACSAGDLRLSSGNPIPEGKLPSVTARRVVSVEGTTAVLRVVVW